MKKIILSLLVIGFAFNSVAQDEKETYVSPKHYIGLHAGATTGYGLSYRYWPTKLGVELTTSPYIESKGNYNISTGLSVLYSLFENKYIGLYSYLGNSLVVTNSNSIQVYNPNTGGYTFGEKSTKYNVGLGMGFKVNVFKELDFNIQTGYGFYNLNKADDFYTFLTGEISIYYHF